MSTSCAKDGPNQSKPSGNEKRSKRKTKGKNIGNKNEPTHNNTLSMGRCVFFIR